MTASAGDHEGRRLVLTDSGSEVCPQFSQLFCCMSFDADIYCFNLIVSFVCFTPVLAV